MIESWCQCFSEYLFPDTPTSNTTSETAAVDPLTASPPLPNDKYFVRKVVGSGATGTALIGRRCRDGLPIIAKIVELGDMDSTQRERTDSEIECLSRCRHSSIIQYLTHHVVGTKLLVVMELADAGDLGFQIKHRRESRAFFTEHETALMLAQVLIAVDYIHSQSILHRDIKPANVFVKANGLVKIGDFGLSKIFEETVSRPVADSLVGTPYYLAPEVWKREKYGKKADMFSIGVLWFEMLTLERPFKGQSVTAVMQAIIDGVVPALPPTVSDDSAAIVRRLLSHNPDERPSIVEIFESPLMDHALRIFCTMIVNNIPASPAARQNIQADAMILRRKVQAHVESKSRRSQPLSAEQLAALSFSSPIVHLEDGKKWKHRAIKLTVNGTLMVAKGMEAFASDGTEIAERSSADSGSPSKSMDSKNGTDSKSAILRVVPMGDIFKINRVPQCFAEGRPNVFAITLRESDDALWFYSMVDQSVTQEWMTRVTELCGRGGAL